MDDWDDKIDTRYCFRCKDMAVIDMGHINLLPFVLQRARYLLMKAKFDNPEDTEEVWGVGDSLFIYTNILENISTE